MTCLKLSMGTLSLLHHHLAGDKGLALLLSGEVCGSLWEWFSVWMTLTARVSRVPINQLNPDRGDKARRAWTSTYASVWPASCINTHIGKQKHKQAHKHTPEDGSLRSQLPPALSQLLVTWVTQLQTQHGWNRRWEKWADGKKGIWQEEIL